ncbi:MAG: hypothetical protein ACFB4I_08590 [Cyanophyceae cyanobacterium]
MGREHRDLAVVELAENVLLRTNTPKENHAALRSGFAGYPTNPRWNVGKYRAWRTGSQLRQDLSQGKVVVRPSDFMLVPVAE